MLTLHLHHAGDAKACPLADINYGIGWSQAHCKPLPIRERGEKAVMPPAIWIQGRPDEVHDYHDEDSSCPGNETERFVSNYRKAGGDIEITYFDNAQRGTEATHKPTLDFIKKHLG